MENLTRECVPMYSDNDAVKRLRAAADKLLAENEKIYICAQNLAVMSLTVADGDVETAEKLLHTVEDFIAATIDYMRSRAPDQSLLDALAG